MSHLGLYLVCHRISTFDANFPSYPSNGFPSFTRPFSSMMIYKQNGQPRLDWLDHVWKIPVLGELRKILQTCPMWTPFGSTNANLWILGRNLPKSALFVVPFFLAFVKYVIFPKSETYFRLRSTILFRKGINIWDFKIAFSNFFFRQNIFEPYKRARREGRKNRSSRSLTLTLDFKKILKGPKMERKSLNLYRGLWARDSCYDSEAILSPFLDLWEFLKVEGWR